MKEKPKIKHTKNDTIIVEYKNKRYELYFDSPKFVVFVGVPQDGSMVEIPDPHSDIGGLQFTYYKKW